MLGVFVVKQKQVDVMETFAFGRHVVDQKTCIILILKNQVNANIRILFLKFGKVFKLDGKIDSVKVQGALKLGVTVNEIGVVFRRMQAGQDGIFETALVVIDNVNDCVLCGDTGCGG